MNFWKMVGAIIVAIVVAVKHASIHKTEYMCVQKLQLKEIYAQHTIIT